MNPHPPSPGLRRQHGAIVIVFALSMVALFGFMALVIDLGRTYVVRTELQNAADAAALAGAKELDQTATGVTNAVNYAIAMAAQNSFKLSAPVIITIADISVGNCPDEGCMVPASSIGTSDAQAAGKTFLKVDIPSGGLATFFALAAGTGVASTSTYGRAVAGRFVYDVTPIGICAIKNAAGASRPKGEALPGNELAQFGFRRGVSYSVFNLGPLGSPSDSYLINPVDSYSSGNCDPNNASANITAPFICSGSTAVLTTTPDRVYGNTGVSAGKIEKALNSRFNDYTGASVCIPAQAPPDINIRKFACTGAGCASPAVDWMTPTPTVQTMSDPGMPLAPATIASADKYGVLWSYSRAVRAVAGTTPCAITDPCPAGTAFDATAADWVTLYPSLVGQVAPNAYPIASPYLDSGHSTPPPGNPGKADRRVLNLMIADCPNVSGTGNCVTIPVLGVGRFFMQVPADFSGNPKKLEVEFAGLIQPVPVTEIKLYR